MLGFEKVHWERTSQVLNILEKYRWIIVFAVGGLIAVSGARASDLDEPDGSILPTKFPALTNRWAAEHCDVIADYRVTVDNETLSEYSSEYIALAKEVDRKVAELGGNGYIWLSVGRARNRDLVENIWEPFVEIVAWECERLPWTNWQELIHEHWPELVEDR